MHKFIPFSVHPIRFLYKYILFSLSQDLYSVMIKGPERTPYEDGLFFFDFQLSEDYPKVCVQTSEEKKNDVESLQTFLDFFRLRRSGITSATAPTASTPTCTRTAKSASVFWARGAERERRRGRRIRTCFNFLSQSKVWTKREEKSRRLRSLALHFPFFVL